MFLSKLINVLILGYLDKKGESVSLRCFASLSKTHRTARNNKRAEVILLFCPIVRVIGLEPTRRKTPDPKSGASTNFATRATDFAFASAKIIQNFEYCGLLFQ